MEPRPIVESKNNIREQKRADDQGKQSLVKKARQCAPITHQTSMCSVPSP